MCREGEYKEKIRQALDIAFDYGQMDGAHHKAWTIDQMVYALFGDEWEYNEYIKKYENGRAYEWDKGIAP